MDKHIKIYWLWVVVAVIFFAGFVFAFMCSNIFPDYGINEAILSSKDLSLPPSDLDPEIEKLVPFSPLKLMMGFVVGFIAIYSGYGIIKLTYKFLFKGKTKITRKDIFDIFYHFFLK